MPLRRVYHFWSRWRIAYRRGHGLYCQCVSGNNCKDESFTIDDAKQHVSDYNAWVDAQDVGYVPFDDELDKVNDTSNWQQFYYCDCGKSHTNTSFLNAITYVPIALKQTIDVNESRNSVKLNICKPKSNSWATPKMCSVHISKHRERGLHNERHRVWIRLATWNAGGWTHLAAQSLQSFDKVSHHQNSQTTTWKINDMAIWFSWLICWWEWTGRSAQWSLWQGQLERSFQNAVRQILFQEDNRNNGIPHLGI